MATVIKHDDDIRELSQDEARKMFEATVQRRLKMSTDEFLQRLDNGEFTGKEEDPRFMSILSLLPLVR